MQAALLDVKLPYLDKDNARRREISKYYRKNIKNPKVILPTIDNEESHVWHIFAIRTDNRDDFIKHLKENGIETNIHYPTPPHKQLAYTEYKELSFPISELIHQTEVSIPMSPTLRDDEVKTIVDVINKF